MDSRWTKGLSGKEKEQRIKTIKSFAPAFEELSELLKTLKEETVNDYDCPSWSHKQADANGANRKLRDVQALLNIKD